AQTTRAERTGYRETSTYADVGGFLDSLRVRTDAIRLDTLARSSEGRAIPYVVASRPPVRGPADAARSGKPVVYLQANIHGGEVEGKEAAQMLLRDLTLGALAPLLDSLVLLVVPIYNVDGNEALAPGDTNRPGQNGPALVGRRANGQGLDLNRDYVKQEAPETRGAAALMLQWNPHLFMDLHTTNGSYHGYDLTHAGGLNPNPTPANDYVRDRLLPTLRRRMAQRHRRATFPYGNFRNQHPDSLVQGWETYDARPRFGTNWIGLRGRMAVLSEAYSNDDFRTRVASTYDFVREVLSVVAEERDTIMALAAPPRPDSVAVRSRLGPPTRRPVVAELTEEAGEGHGGYVRRRRTGAFRTIEMPVYDRFVAARREALPELYLVPERLAPVLELLRRQGIAVERLRGPMPEPREAFAVDSVGRGPAFEGHHPVRIEGRWTEQRTAPTEPGWYLVSTAQPLGLLAAYLLEPASEDGVVTWNLLDAELSPGRPYPILRSRRATAAAGAMPTGGPHVSDR
ncbi:MAG: M14 family zinc carboxypeptidase, partial [Gemmatimonadales bacterium]